MRLQVGRSLDHVHGADEPADPPPGHGVGLGHPVDHHGAVGQFRNFHRHRGEPGVPVDEVLVDLVGEHPQVVFEGPPADLADLLGRVHCAGRVRGGDEQQHLGAVGAGRLQLLDRGQVASGLVGDHVDRGSSGQPDRFRVGGPVGRDHDDLVARIEQRGERLVDRLLAAVGDQDLVRLHPVAGVAQRLSRDGFLEFGEPPAGV